MSDCDAVATARPPREEYPDPSREDLAAAIRAARDDADSEHPWSHHVRGRYTAHRTHTEHEPDAKPGVKHVAIRVVECEREIIMNVPEEQVDEVLTVLDADAESDTAGDA